LRWQPQGDDMSLFGFLDPDVRKTRKILREVQENVQQSRKPYNEFLLTIVKCSTECTNYAKAFIEADGPVDRAVIERSIFSEYASLFCHIGLRVAYTTIKNETSIFQLQKEAKEQIPLVIADAYFSGMREPDKSRCIEHQRGELIEKVKLYDDFYDRPEKTHFERLLGAFLYASNLVSTECNRSDDWDSIREPLVNKVIEQWKVSHFQRVLAPLCNEGQV
jgi:hypothetical protein